MSVSMYGPSFDDSTKVVNREVPEADVVAFEQAGYVKGRMADAPDLKHGGGKPSKSDAKDEDPLDKMTKAELLEEAAKRGVEVASSANKAEILEALNAKGE